MAEQFLCAAADLADGGKAHVFELLEFGRTAHAFVLRFEGRLVGYLNRCAHVPAQMDWQPGEFLDADRRYILCSIHGAAYAPHTGLCVGGPCGRGRLKALKVAEREGQVYWYPEGDLKPFEFDSDPSDTTDSTDTSDSTGTSL